MKTGAEISDDVQWGDEGYQVGRRRKTRDGLGMAAEESLQVEDIDLCNCRVSAGWRRWTSFFFLERWKLGFWD